MPYIDAVSRKSYAFDKINTTVEVDETGNKMKFIILETLRAMSTHRKRLEDLQDCK